MVDRTAARPSHLQHVWPAPPVRATALQYLSGGDVDLGRIGEEYGRCVGLPAYPWQRSRHWLDDQCIPTRESDAAEVPFR